MKKLVLVLVVFLVVGGCGRGLKKVEVLKGKMTVSINGVDYSWINPSKFAVNLKPGEEGDIAFQHSEGKILITVPEHTDAGYAPYVPGAGGVLSVKVEGDRVSLQAGRNITGEQKIELWVGLYPKLEGEVGMLLTARVLITIKGGKK